MNSPGETEVMRVPKHFLDAPQENTIIRNTIRKEKFPIPLSITRRILSLLGSLPCSRKSPHWPSFDRRKSNVVYGAVVLTILTSVVIFLIVRKKIEYDGLDGLNPAEVMRKTFIIEYALLMLPQLLVYSMWMDVPKMRNFMKLFSNVKVNFERTTGKLLENRTVTFEKIFSYTSLITPIGFYYLLAFTIPHIDRSVHASFAAMYGNTIGLYTVVYWNITSMSIFDALEDIEFEFKKRLESNKLTASFVYEFRLLWLSLRALCDSMGKWNCPFTGYSVCMCLSIVLLYEGLSLLQEEKIGASFGHISAGFIYVIIIFLSCRASHEVENKMKCLVKEVLSNISLSSFEAGVQKEIVMLYLVESSRPAITTFQGTLVINRHFILTFFSSVSTYIIVLVQCIQKNSDIIL